MPEKVILSDIKPINMNIAYRLIAHCITYCCISAISANTMNDIVKTSPQNKPFYKRLSINAEFSIRSGGKYHIEQEGCIIEEGENDAYTQSNISASVPFVQRKNLVMIGTLKYSHIHQHFNPDIQTLDYGFGETTHHIISVNLIASSKLDLWDKSIKLTGMASGEYSQFGFERWMAMGTSLLMLKETPKTEIGIGVIGMINTFSKIPVFPFFTYKHTFSNHWMINITPPYMQVKYLYNNSNIYALGTSFYADHYFIHPNTETLPNRVRYSRSLLNIGLTYEHKVSAKLSVTMNAGVSIIMTDRINNSGGSQEIAKVSEGNSPYCRIAISKRF